MESSMKKIKKRFIILPFLLLILVGIFQIYRSYNCLTVQEYRYQTDKISSQIKMIVLSDLHNHEFGEDNLTLISKVRKQEPDAIFLVGDFLNASSRDSSVVISLVEKLTEIAPVYFSLGNHEVEFTGEEPDALMEEIRNAGASVMELSYIDAEIRGESIRIGGMYDYAFALDGNNTTEKDHMDPKVYSYLTDFQDTDGLKIMMAHRPDSFIFGEASKTWDVDLILSGHDHGGQIVLPFAGGLWAPDQGWFPEYVHGLYQKDKIEILITSGLGSQSETLPRFNNPPEIAVLVIEPGQS